MELEEFRGQKVSKVHNQQAGFGVKLDTEGKSKSKSQLNTHIFVMCLFHKLNPIYQKAKNVKENHHSISFECLS